MRLGYTQHSFVNDTLRQETSAVKSRCFALSTLFALLALFSAAVRLMARPEAPKQYDQKLFQELRWRSIGPFRGGRVLAVTGVRSQPEVYYFGSVGGGVWRRNDDGG